MNDMAGQPTDDRQDARRFVPAAVLTLAAGTVMVVGGYVFHQDGWAVSGPLMYPAGPLISVGFLLAARAAGAPPMTGVSRLRLLVLLLLGVPSPGAGVSPAKSLAVTLLSLVAGLAMAVAGYAIAAWTVLLVPPLFLVAGGVILLAFFAGRPASTPAGAASLAATADLAA